MNVNDLEVAEALLYFYPYWIPRSKLADETGLPRTTVYDSLKRLDLKGMIDTELEPRNTRGRKKTLFRLIP